MNVLRVGLFLILIIFYAITARADDEFVREDSWVGPVTGNRICVLENGAGADLSSYYLVGRKVDIYESGQLINSRSTIATVTALDSNCSSIAPYETTTSITINETLNGGSFGGSIKLFIPDTTPPTQSNLTAGSITQTGATITWTTNESATHTIKYGTTSGSYDSYPNTKAAGSGTSASGAL